MSIIIKHLQAGVILMFVTFRMKRAISFQSISHKSDFKSPVISNIWPEMCATFSLKDEFSKTQKPLSHNVWQNQSHCKQSSPMTMDRDDIVFPFFSSTQTIIRHPKTEKKFLFIFSHLERVAIKTNLHTNWNTHTHTNVDQTSPSPKNKSDVQIIWIPQKYNWFYQWFTMNSCEQ